MDDILLSHYYYTKALELDGMSELLAIASQHCIPLQGGDLSPPIPKHPVIVVEGLDAAGVYILCVCVCVCVLVVA